MDACVQRIFQGNNHEMNKSKIFSTICTLAVVVAISAVSCGRGPVQQFARDSESGISEGTPTSIGFINSDTGVLDPCRLDIQETIMLPGEVPDWEALGVSTCYQLWLKILPDQHGYEGAANIAYTNYSREPQSELVFRLYPNAPRIYGGNLDVTSARVNGYLTNPEIFLEDRTGLRLRLNKELDPGKTIMLNFEFEGRLNAGLDNSSGVYGIYNYSKDVNIATYANWYPILAEWEHGDWQARPVSGIGDAVVSETALYIVEISSPEEFQIITSGKEVSKMARDGNVVYTVASGPVRDFFVVSGKNFILTQGETGGVLINHWGLPGGDDRWSEALYAAMDAVDLSTERFGPYPYRELDVVSVPLQLASGVEYPELILIRDDLYFPNDDQPFLLSLIIAHESAHQWWYALVGNDVLEHPWQDEALTTFTSLLYLEQFNPRVYPGTVNYFNQLSADLDQEPSIGRAAESFLTEPELYSPMIYSQGALFFVELRRKIGDDHFFEALRSYFEDSKYQLASPNDLLAKFSNACDCELDEFFDSWGLGESND